MKMLWCISSGALFPLLNLNPGGETAWAWPRRSVPRAQSRLSDDAETKAHCPDSSTWEIPSPVHPLNAGAPSSKLSAEDQTTDPKPMGQDEGGGGGTDLHAADSQPQEMLTH